MDILELIKTRRSIRKYKKKSIPDNLMNKILESGRWAPSGLNNQPWKFIVIKNKNTIKEISKFTKYSHVILSAPVLICVFLDNSLTYNRVKDIQAIGACIQNMLLTIHAEKLGACWLGEIINKRKKVEKFLDVPEHFELMAVISIGYPAYKRKSHKRKPLKEILYKTI